MITHHFFVSRPLAGYVLGAVAGLRGRAAASVQLRLRLRQPAAAAGAGHRPEPIDRNATQ